MPPAYLLTPKRSLPEEDGMASCTPPKPRRSDSIHHMVSMEPMKVPALKLCDADEAEELGFRFILDPPPNIPCKRGNDDDSDINNDEASSSSSFVPIERAHRSSVSDPILKIRPRPSRALFAASSTASTVHSNINMNVGITLTPIDDDDEEEEEEVELASYSSSPPRAKPKSAAANIITPTKAMMTRSIMKKSYKLAVRNNKRKEVRSTVNKNAAAAATTTTANTPRPSCSSPAAT